MTVGPAAPIGEPVHAGVLIALVNLVPGLTRDTEVVTDHRHLLAVQEASNEPKTLIHDVTLLPRHAPSCKRGVQSVTYVSGIRCYLSLRKDKCFK